MPRDGANVYAYPPGTPGIPDTTVASTPYNSYIDDVQQDLNLPRPIVAGGTGAGNILTARANLKTEVATQTITNFDDAVWEAGSFFAAAGAPGAPTTSAFYGICYIRDVDDLTIEARARGDALAPAGPGTKYARQKKTGVWGPWVAETTPTPAGTEGGFAGVTADMWYGLRGTAPGSWFAVNTKADATGTDVFRVQKGGSVVQTAIPAAQGGTGSTNLTLDKEAAANTQSNIYGSRGLLGRWVIQLGNDTAEAGANAGSDFAIGRYSDAGAFLATPFWIKRSNGEASFNKDLHITTNTVTSQLYMGNAGRIFATDGVNFALNGPLGVIDQIAARASSAGANAQITFQDETAVNRGFCFWQRSTDSILMQHANGNAVVLHPTGRVDTTLGFGTRNGASGGPTGSIFNFTWGTPAPGMHAWIDNTDLGEITFTCDYRTKKDVADLGSMWNAVKALRPISYTQAAFTPPSEAGKSAEPFIPADDVPRYGFVAHELQETLLPSAASGVKDDPNAIQSPNLMAVVAALTKCIQEAQIRIEALEERLALAEGRSLP